MNKKTPTILRNKLFKVDNLVSLEEFTELFRFLIEEFSENYNFEKLYKKYKDIYNDFKFYKKIKILEKFELNNNKKYSVDFWKQFGHSEEEANLKIIELINNKKESSILSKEYWIKKGLTREEAKQKISEIQKNNSKKFTDKIKLNPEKYKLQYYNIEKIKESLNCTQDEAIKISNNRKKETSNLCKEFWIKKGFTEEEAKEEISKMQIKNAFKFSKKRKENPEKYLNCRKKEFWLKKGFSEEEAIEKLKEITKKCTYNLENCILKYGEELGTQKFNQRQINWQNTLKNLPNYSDIVFRRVSRNKFYSKESIRIFEIFLKELEELGLNIENYNWKDNEFFLRNDKKIYFYDLTFLKEKIIIEYNGHRWHPNNNLLSKQEWENWKSINNTKDSADIVYNKDKEKIDFAIKNGFNVYFIWSNENIEDQINKIKKEIYDKFDKK